MLDITLQARYIVRTATMTDRATSRDEALIRWLADRAKARVHHCAVAGEKGGQDSPARQDKAGKTRYDNKPCSIAKENKKCWPGLMEFH